MSESLVEEPGMEADPPCPSNNAPLSMEKTESTGEHLNEKEYLKEPDKLNSMGNGETADKAVNETEKELQNWEERTIKAEKEKTEVLLLKLAADRERSMRLEELTKLKDLEDKATKERSIVQEKRQRERSLIDEQNTELRREIQTLKAKIAAKNAQYEALAQHFRLKNIIPEKKMKFTQLENVRSVDMYINISCLFHVAAKIPFKLCQGEALITFEDEHVAQGLIRKHCHTVNLENEQVVVRALPVTLERGVTFQLHAKISRKKINVSNIPHLNIPQEWMRDKLELNMYKANLGGEVENVTYDPQSQMALITFGQPIASNNIVRCGRCPFHTGEMTHFVMASPIIQKDVENFQVFSGVSRRTILLTGIKTEEEDEESVEDMITIYFQKSKNGGGEVENVKYVSQGTKVAYFANDTDKVI